jgi:hypothetical protein
MIDDGLACIDGDCYQWGYVKVIAIANREEEIDN